MLHKVWFEEGWSLPFVHVNIVFVVMVVIVVVISVAFPYCTKHGLFILTFCYCFLVSFVVIIVIEYNKYKIYLWDLMLHKIWFEESWSFPFDHVNVVVIIVVIMAINFVLFPCCTKHGLFMLISFTAWNISPLFIPFVTYLLKGHKISCLVSVMLNDISFETWIGNGKASASTRV